MNIDITIPSTKRSMGAPCLIWIIMHCLIGSVLLIHPRSYQALMTAVEKILPWIFVGSDHWNEYSNDVNLALIALCEAAGFVCWRFSIRSWSDQLRKDAELTPSGMGELRKRSGVEQSNGYLIVGMILLFLWTGVLDWKYGDGPVTSLFIPGALVAVRVNSRIYFLDQRRHSRVKRFVFYLSLASCLLPLLGFPGFLLQFVFMIILWILYSKWKAEGEHERSVVGSCSCQ